MEAVGNVFFFPWEETLIIWIQSWLGSAGKFAATVFTFFGESTFIVGIVVFMYFWISKETGRFAAVSLMAGTTWNPMIKNVALRLRPYMASKSIACLKPVESGYDIMDVKAQGYSFPSGHSSSSMTAFGAVAVRMKKNWVRITAAVLVALVGFSRAALGVHYPTDVLAGWALGILTIAAVSLMTKYIKNRAVLYLILVLIAVPGWFYCTSNDFYTGFGLMVGLFAGMLFEEKFIGFGDPKKWYIGLIRVVGAIAIYFALSSLLKLPFPKEIRDASNYLAYSIRAGRYAIVAFTVGGLYPFLFKYYDRWFLKEKKSGTEERSDM